MSEYLVGIDLGTTHTVVAYIKSGLNNPKEVQILEIPQLVAAGEVSARQMLPSTCYLYAAGELAFHDTGLPWLQSKTFKRADGGGVVVGYWARELGNKTPGRLVNSAKSWLSHSRVDRTANILPWGDSGSIEKISPLQASRCFLEHIRLAWDHQFPDSPLQQQTIVITVPASFDEGARALTISAAKSAGLDQIKLLEEPQAACYEWFSDHPKLAKDNKLLLICDVGGGTTDLTLIEIDQTTQELELKRIGVGNHLMLGGDNIDLALAHQVEKQLGDVRLNYARLSQLLLQTRLAKESLLGPDAPESRNVTVLSSGRQLLTGAKSVELHREHVQALVLEGYFSNVELSVSTEAVRSAVVEFGLPYESEAAITRHIANFILRHQSVMAAGTGLPVDPDKPIVPDSLLLNGGVFNSDQIRSQVSSQVSQWLGRTVNELKGIDPNLAVARGAVVYSLAQLGLGKKIGGGSARSYYLKLKSKGNSKTAVEQVVCLLPKGSPIGQVIPLADREFALVTGDPVRFDLFASTADTQQEAGDLGTELSEQCTALPPLVTVLTEYEQKPNCNETRVQLQSELTEIGTLSVNCINSQTQQKWQLDFQLKSEPPNSTNLNDHLGQLSAAADSEPHPQLEKAIVLIDTLYGKAISKPSPKLIKTFRMDLEKLLGSRSNWDLSLIRGLFDQLIGCQKQRRRSMGHERIWLNLVGYCLRPGYGASIDEWRVEQVNKLYVQGVIHTDQIQVWAEWWTVWRRIAGGLDESMQARIFNDISHYFHPSVARSKRRMAELQKRAYNEMVRLLGSLEGLSVEQKQQAGNWLIERLEKASESEQTWWAVGRLGARVPFHGNTHKTLDAKTAQTWLDILLRKNWRKEKTAAFAATQIARCSGDRELDINSIYQGKVITKLRSEKCPESWQQVVKERVELDQADIKRVFGEALPQGLRLL